MKVLFWVLLFTFSSLLIRGNLLNFFGLRSDRDHLNESILRTQQQIDNLERQMLVVRDPAFIERQALDKLDFAEEDQIVFVFADE